MISLITRLIIHCNFNLETDNYNLSIDDVPMEGRLYQQSPFSYFVIQKCAELNITWRTKRKNKKSKQDDNSATSCDDEESNALQEKNNLYNPKFLEYMIKTVFSMAPLFTHYLIALRGYARLQDNQATSESWNSIVKWDNLREFLPLKVGRLLNELFHIVNGNFNLLL